MKKLLAKFFRRKLKGAFQAYNPALQDQEVEIENEESEPTVETLEKQSESITQMWESANTLLDRYREKKVNIFLF